MRRLADVVVRWPWAVIGVWIAIAVALPLTFPSLNEMAQRNPLAILPSDAPSSVAAREMTEAFHESGSDNLLVVAFINETGLKPADEAAYRKVVDALRDDVTDVVMIQDFFTTPPLRPFLTSKDKTTWVLPVGLAGEMGTPRAYDAYNRVADLVKHKAAGASVTVHVTGPAATSPTSPSLANRIACRSRLRSASWCYSFCWWCTATRSPCFCRWRRSGRPW